MKILHIIPTYLPAPLTSGPIQPIHTLNRELVRLGHEVSVYTTNYGTGSEAERVIDGVRVFYFPISFKVWFYSGKMRRALRENIKKFDVIHISSIFLAPLFFGAYYARKYKKPYLITLHGILMKEPLKSKWLKKKAYLAFWEKKNLQNADNIHFTSHEEEKEYPFDTKGRIVLPLPILSSYNNRGAEGNKFRTKWNISPGKKIVLFLGRLNWIKGFDTLLPAWQDVLKEERDTILVLSGPDAGYKNKILEYARDLKIKDSVLLTGELDVEDKIQALEASSIFVLTSYSENFSVATAEAMDFGLPVVITEGVGLAELVKRYKAGIVVYKNKDSVKEAVLQLLKNAQLAQKMGEEGKKLVSVELSPEQVAKTMVGAYQALYLTKGW